MKPALWWLISWAAEEVETEVQNKINDILKIDFIMIERKMIVKAMGFKQGHWYKGRNGHFYIIGECGTWRKVNVTNAELRLPVNITDLQITMHGIWNVWSDSSCMARRFIWIIIIFLRMCTVDEIGSINIADWSLIRTKNGLCYSDSLSIIPLSWIAWTNFRTIILN